MKQLVIFDDFQIFLRAKPFFSCTMSNVWLLFWLLVCLFWFQVTNYNLVWFFSLEKLFLTQYYCEKTALWPLFMNEFQLCQGYRVTLRRQFTFYHSVPRSSWYSFHWLWKDERLSQPWSHPMVLKLGPLNWFWTWDSS